MTDEEDFEKLSKEQDREDRMASFVLEASKILLGAILLLLFSLWLTGCSVCDKDCPMVMYANRQSQ